MTDYDPKISALLERMIPPVAEARDWQRLLADASVNQTLVKTKTRTGPLRRRWLFVLAVALSVAVLIPLTALAVGLATGQDWWFLSPSKPTPTGSIAVVQSGRWNGTPWTLTAFRATTGNVCYAVTVNPSRPRRGSIEACGSITPTAKIGFLRNTGALSEIQGWKNLNARREKRGLAPMLPRPTSSPEYIVGAVVSSATEVDVTGPQTPVQRIATIAPPPGLHARVRFFIAQRPDGEDVDGLIARDAKGRTVAAMTVESPFQLKDYRLSYSGKKLPLTKAAIHQLQLSHRSPEVYLLASRNGLNIYRLGTNGRCFGVGHANKLSWVPARNVLHIVGIITCDSGFPSPTNPIQDTSIYGQSTGQKGMTIYQFSGIASNEIVAIDLVNANGTVVKRVPVINSVFDANPVPSGIVGINPINADGVWVSRCGFGKGSFVTSSC